MKKAILILVTIIIGLSSCKKEKTIGNPDRFKSGVFEIPAGNGYSKTTIKRIDSLHIEEYSKEISINENGKTSLKQVKRIDTLYIKWVNNFAYTLRMKNPKTKLDSDPIFVQLTKVTDSSYNFKAKIGHSKFTQDGTVYKIE